MKLNLKVGERVRNIRVGSARAGWQGVVIVVTDEQYVVRWNCGEKQDYFRRFSHKNLERIGSFGTAYRDACMMFPYERKEMLRALLQLEGCKQEGARKVLKRERRNVITGQTQAEMQSQYGPAKGGVIFNTRTLGRSTGQAFRILGEAMCNPGIAIRYEDVDHAISEGTSNRVVLNRHFEQVLRDTIGERKGFTFERGHVTFNPIVTEETYVTQ